MEKSDSLHISFGVIPQEYIAFVISRGGVLWCVIKKRYFHHRLEYISIPGLALTELSSDQVYHGIIRWKKVKNSDYN